MIFKFESRSIGITKEQVWNAWLRIKQGGEAVGVDEVTIEMIERNPRKYLYPVWNRLSSGSYFPPAVKEVAIPKQDGKERMLGIPTMTDRVAQEVIRAELEQILEPRFHPHSYGYRPNKSAHQALKACADNCWSRWYVVDLDIKKFFDTIDHNKMMDMLRNHTTQRHILLYCERWLKAPVQKADGTITERERGMPQGGVISPLLANLYLHEVFDKWMLEYQSNSLFERYADDIVIHTRSQGQSNFLLNALVLRFREYGLELNEDKSKIVYCYRTARFYKAPKEIASSFDFLGFTFKPRLCQRGDGQRFWGFRPSVSVSNLKRMNATFNKLHRRVSSTLTQLAEYMAPKLRGWIQYYGTIRKSGLWPLCQRLNIRLAKWVNQKYRFRSMPKSFAWLRRVGKSYPTMFIHWQYGWLP